MLKSKTLCLLIAALMLAGCAVSNPPSLQPTTPYPALDSNLAQPCPTLVVPEVADYDAWQTWVQDVVLVEYGKCGANHRRTVEAWPKAPTTAGR